MNRELSMSQDGVDAAETLQRLKQSRARAAHLTQVRQNFTTPTQLPSKPKWLRTLDAIVVKDRATPLAVDVTRSPWWKQLEASERRTGTAPTSAAAALAEPSAAAAALALPASIENGTTQDAAVDFGTGTGTVQSHQRPPQYPPHMGTVSTMGTTLQQGHALAYPGHHVDAAVHPSSPTTAKLPPQVAASCFAVATGHTPTVDASVHVTPASTTASTSASAVCVASTPSHVAVLVRATGAGAPKVLPREQEVEQETALRRQRQLLAIRSEQAAKDAARGNGPNSMIASSATASPPADGLMSPHPTHQAAGGNIGVQGAKVGSTPAAATPLTAMTSTLQGGLLRVASAVQDTNDDADGGRFFKGATFDREHVSVAYPTRSAFATGQHPPRYETSVRMFAIDADAFHPNGVPKPRASNNALLLSSSVAAATPLDAAKNQQQGVSQDGQNGNRETNLPLGALASPTSVPSELAYAEAVMTAGTVGPESAVAPQLEALGLPDDAVSDLPWMAQLRREEMERCAPPTPQPTDDAATAPPQEGSAPQPL